MRQLSDGEREVLRDCEWDVEGLYDGERDCHAFEDDYDDAVASPPRCPLLSGCTAEQIEREREWATTVLVRLWERGGVSFDFLCDSQQRLGCGGDY